MDRSSSKALQLATLALLVSAGALPIGLKWGQAGASTGMDETPHGVQRATRGLPAYKGVRPQALSADGAGHGANIETAWFMTRDTPEQVLGFYEGALSEAGLPVLSHRYVAHAGYVGYRAPGSQQVHLVSVLGQGEETLVLLSSAPDGTLAEAPREQVPPELPLPEGVRPSWVMNLRADGRVRSSVLAEAPRSKVDALEDFYLRTLRAQGWSLDRPSEHLEDKVLLRAWRGEARVSAWMEPRATGTLLYLTLDRP